MDFDRLANALGVPDVKNMNTALEVYEKTREKHSQWVADNALNEVRKLVPLSVVDVMVMDRQGNIIAQAGP